MIAPWVAACLPGRGEGGWHGGQAQPRLAVRIRQKPGHSSGAASWAGCDLLPKLNFNPAHKSPRPVPCYPPSLTPAWAGVGIASSDGLCSCGAAGPVCPGERDGHARTGLGILPATGHWGWLWAQPSYPGQKLCHQSGALKAWARVPVGLWVALLSERPGFKS